MAAWRIIDAASMCEYNFYPTFDFIGRWESIFYVAEYAELMNTWYLGVTIESNSRSAGDADHCTGYTMMQLQSTGASTSRIRFTPEN